MKSFSRTKESFGSLYVSRRELDRVLPEGEMSDEKRITGIRKGGPRLALFKIWDRPNEQKVLAAFNAAVPFFADTANYDERLLHSYLALLAQGQISPRSLPSLREGE